MQAAPSCGAETLASAPPIAPIGVRTPATINERFFILGPHLGMPLVYGKGRSGISGWRMLTSSVECEAP